MSGATWGMLAVIAAYLVFIILVGVFYSRQSTTVSDFYLGGRKLGPLVTAMSAEASDMSSYLLMGLPGLAYISGLADAAWTAIGLAVGTYLNWLFVSKRIRRYSEKIRAITIPEFFSKRFHDNKKMLQIIAAVVIVVFFVPYTASGFAACGKLFGTLFDAPYLPTMIICAIIIIAYTTLGGFMAASTSDFIQSVFMTIALIVVVIFGIGAVGSFSDVIENAKELPGYFSMTQTYDAATGTSSSYSVLTIVSTLAWGLGYFGMPHILLRFMGTKSEKNLKTSRRVASVWVVISMAVAVLIGIIGIAMSHAGEIATLDSVESETVIIRIAMLISENGWVAIIFAGIVLAGILACTMSTADSQLLAASSSVSQDIVQSLFKLKLTKRTEMLVARLTVIVVAIVAVFIASDPDSSVFGIVSFAWAGFGAAFGPVVLFSLFWKRTNKWGALAGMITGGVMVFVWKYLIAPIGGVLDIYELLPAFLLACIALVVVSLLTAPPDQEIVEEFEEVKRGDVTPRVPEEAAAEINAAAAGCSADGASAAADADFSP
ncbi:MAG: sodium/proline symporter [Oscillospiraceae bacterium]|nr:sodium/proline symporter [Oscillospiraceae bacterium]